MRLGSALRHLRAVEGLPSTGIRCPARRSRLSNPSAAFASASMAAPLPSAPSSARLSNAPPSSSTLVLDGRSTAARMCDDLRALVAAHRQPEGSSLPHRPGLAVVLAGDRRDSLRYVARKTEMAAELGFHAEVVHLPSDCSEERLLAEVRRLNADARVHGVLVQLPLPRHISQSRVLEAVSVDKDVDGFHPYNMGLLVHRYALTVATFALSSDSPAACPRSGSPSISVSPLRLSTGRVRPPSSRGRRGTRP